MSCRWRLWLLHGLLVGSGLGCGRSLVPGNAPAVADAAAPQQTDDAASPLEAAAPQSTAGDAAIADAATPQADVPVERAPETAQAPPDASSGPDAATDGSDAHDVAPADRDAQPDLEVCVPACALGATRCGRDGLETCVLESACPAWGPPKPCPGSRICVGSAPSASCECSTPPPGCTPAPGVACESTTTVVACSQDESGCVTAAVRRQCPAGRPCTGSFPAAGCTCPAVPEQCARGTGSFCTAGGALARCDFDADGCMSLQTPKLCAVSEICRGNFPTAKCACNATTVGQPCGRCGGTVTCDGSCSIPTPANYGATCGLCAGTVTCDGTCSVSTPADHGAPCGSCGGTVTCDGSCSVPTPADHGAACGSCGGTIQCDGSCSISLTDETCGQFYEWAAHNGVTSLVADFDGDKRSDIALVGGGLTSIPVAYSNGDGTFRITNTMPASFPAWATQAPTRLVGDFDGDGKGDVALCGVSGWRSLPTAMCKAGGSFQVVNGNVGAFGGWAALAPTRLAGDFDGDGKTDVLLMGTNGWGSMPIAFSKGQGLFSVTNEDVGDFAFWAVLAPTHLRGDFDGDGKADVALTGVPGWGSIPVAFSNGDGSFLVTNEDLANFPGFAGTAPVRLAGDFDGDGKTDILLTGPSNWRSLPVAFSNGDGTFRATNVDASDFAVLSATAAAHLVGDFDGDKKADLLVTGAPQGSTLPVAFSKGDGSFSIKNSAAGDFARWSSTARAYLVGDFDGDGKSDVALTGALAARIPVAFSKGDGSFTVTNK